MTKKQEIKKILIANRGEIATRILRTTRELGLRSVAIYSEPDRLSTHVLLADEAYPMEGKTSEETYLQIDKIIEIAHKSGANAIHPGYGFLSENSFFAKKTVDAGLIFIGPTPEAIQLMGDKLTAKKAAKAANIPLLPGTDEPVSSIEQLEVEAKRIGYPLLIKAAAGGGGKGMRVVRSQEELIDGYKRAKSEAGKSFGEDAVFLEKFVENPRHIEIQVFSDSHGNHVHLFERDCSIQRRHQKVIEESPSAVLTNEMRHNMGMDAIKIAKQCNYLGAGTVEFILDGENYFFLEMNTRLQVEHPVTEQVTNLDLVKWQIKIAQGETLPLTQSEIKLQGHAIELRVYAENPLDGFLPSIGKIEDYQIPKGPGIRVDDGIIEGGDISIYYDPMIAKLIVTAPTRIEAINRMKRAIHEYNITGVVTTLSFGKFVMNHPEFVSGNYNTNFVRDHYTVETPQKQETSPATAENLISGASLLLQRRKTNLTPENNDRKWSSSRKSHS